MGGKDEDDKGTLERERRQAERVPVRIGVRFRGTDDVARAIKAYSVNFSAGGLCLRTAKAYPLGHQLEISMEVAGEELKLQAVVAWAREGTIGVRFVMLSEEHRGRLVQMLADLKS